MRGASATAVETLTGALDSAVAGGADAARLADDLFGVAAVLRREPGLRRVLTDVSVDADARSALMGNVFDAKVDKPALDLVSRAASLRWASTSDLGTALEQLGVLAVATGADRAGQGEDLLDDLFALEHLVRGTPDLRDALSDPARSDDDKRALLRRLLDGKVTPEASRLAEQAVVGAHRTVVGALEEYQDLAARGRSRLLATVRVARPISDADMGRLEQALAAKYDRVMHTNVVVDPDLLGGIRIEIGDDVIDGTIVNRLDNARRQLAG